MKQALKPLATGFYGRAFEEIDRELACLATMCGTDAFDSLVRDRVLHNDATVCSVNNPVAFAKMRTLLMMHYVIHARAAVVLGDGAANALVDQIDDRIRARVPHH
jgi:hypothetical protein